MTTDLTDRQQTLLKILDAHPRGATMGYVAELAGVPMLQCTYDFRVMRNAGVIGPAVNGGRQALWATATHKAALKAERERIREAMRQASEARKARLALSAPRRAQEKAWREAQEAQDELENRLFIRQPIHAWRKLGAWEVSAPVGGPISVFHQAAAKPSA